MPGFSYLNDDFTAHIDSSDNKAAECHSFIVEIISIGARFVFNPDTQLRYDLSHLLLNQLGVFIGTNVDESVFQALLVWRLRIDSCH